jgi:hypothetical protein
MKTKKYIDYTFQSSCGKTPEYIDWKKCFKSDIKAIIGESLELLKKSSDPHFECSGFIKNKKTGKLVYFSSGDLRFRKNGWLEHILIRTAGHEKDWSGGSNQYTTLANIGKVALSLTA